MSDRSHGLHTGRKKTPDPLTDSAEKNGLLVYVWSVRMRTCSAPSIFVMRSSF